MKWVFKKSELSLAVLDELAIAHVEDFANMKWPDYIRVEISDDRLVFQNGDTTIVSFDDHWCGFHATRCYLLAVAKLPELLEYASEAQNMADISALESPRRQEFQDISEQLSHIKNVKIN
jgi:hypothetical protein